MTQSDMLRNFFDFNGLYHEIRKNTLDDFPTIEEYLQFIEDQYEDKERGERLYNFIKNPDHDKLFLDLEIGEDIELTMDGDILTMYFWEDTSYSNEGGSHDGGYEYFFSINLDLENFIGLEIVNQN